MQEPEVVAAGAVPPRLNEGRVVEPVAGAAVVAGVVPVVGVAGLAPKRLPPNKPPPAAGAGAAVEPVSAGLAVVLPKRPPVAGAVEANF